MNRQDGDIAFIRAIAELADEKDLGEIEVNRSLGESDVMTVRVCRMPPPPVAAPVAVAAAPAMQPVPSTAAPAAPAASEAPAPAAESGPAAGTVTSPMVGTTYLSPEPGAAPFVAVGQQVTEGQTILIIEAMKTMNQIPAPWSGTLTAILVSDAEPVEFSSPLMVIT